MILLSECSGMWKESVKKITIVKHHIHLNPDSSPAFAYPHRTGLKTREQKGEELDLMLKKACSSTRRPNEQVLRLLLRGKTESRFYALAA